jgi:hypothetical protein
VVGLKQLKYAYSICLVGVACLWKLFWAKTEKKIRVFFVNFCFTPKFTAKKKKLAVIFFSNGTPFGHPSKISLFLKSTPGSCYTNKSYADGRAHYFSIKEACAESDWKWGKSEEVSLLTPK